jgi:hypothetical protein
VINQLDSLDKLSRLTNVKQYGDTHEERLFTVGLELCITWVNRILFLKLLEAQLISYHKGDKSYAFLHKGLLHDYDNLNALFFMVLAKKPEERNDRVKTLFAKVPYLNSSLFEPTELEHQTLFIAGLEDDIPLQLLGGTVIKDANGKKLTGTHKAIDYFFDFLDAYDFASEGSEEIQEDNKTLINASVLGLIFEKINGYKDGSFYTPSFITMYMCKETIRRAVVQKFNETKGWNCEDFDALYNKIEDTKEANSIINSVKICDPAVGSGHFLVSALNEMIAIKHDLEVLVDRNGKKLKNYQIDIVNDELIVTDEDGVPFTYNPKSKESQRVQETLFHEKQTIIENCLFGVDINPNSVKICRLRLWIELLKNAYYRNETELETLPNIDINIKCGNSLIARFGLDADLKEALKKSNKSIADYKNAVKTYHNASSKEEKKSMEEFIISVKQNFSSEIRLNDPLKTKLQKLSSELYHRFTGTFLFEPETPYGKSEKELEKKRKAEKEKLEKEIDKIEKHFEEVKNNKIYENAFEWRFEFPEVLNDEGDFVGFDVVIGNPPYLRVRDEYEELRKYYMDNYKVSENQLDLYHLFIEKSFEISTNKSMHSMIVPNAFLGNQNTFKLRNYILDNFSISNIIDIKEDVFDEASVEVLIFIFSKAKMKSDSVYLIAENGKFNFKNYFNSDSFYQNSKHNFTVTLDNVNQIVISKILEKSVELSELFSTISGIKEYQVGKGKPSQTLEQVKNKVFNSNEKIDETYLPELRGKNLSKYSYKWQNEFISYGIWLAEPRIQSFFEGDKILMRQIPAKKSLIASYVNQTFVVDQTAYIAKAKIDLNILFYLGILNSKLLFWYFQNINNEFDNLFPKIKVKEFNTLPLPKIEFSNNALGEKVDQILSLKKDNPAADTSALEREIDFMVYELYGLSEEEIKIVEES